MWFDASEGDWFSYGDISMQISRFRQNRWKFERVGLLQEVHHTVEFVMQPLSQCELSSISCVTANSVRIIIHLMLSPYIASTVEYEEMLSVKCGAQKNQPCQNFLVPKYDMQFGNSATSRSLEGATKMIAKLQSSDDSIQEETQSYSRLSITPIISNFTFVSIHTVVDICCIFRFEPMTRFSLGFTQLLKECAVAMVKDGYRTAPEMSNIAGTERSFKTVRRAVFIRCINKATRR